MCEFTATWDEFLAERVISHGLRLSSIHLNEHEMVTLIYVYMRYITKQEFLEAIYDKHSIDYIYIFSDLFSDCLVLFSQLKNLVITSITHS